MLAEIYMIRLEAATRGSKELLPRSDAQFVPFSPASLFEQKSREANPDIKELVKAIPENNTRRSV